MAPAATALPTRIVVEHETAEISVLFVALGAALAGTALLLARAWQAVP